MATSQDVDPLIAARVDIERYLRWLQDIRRYQPSTVSRRLSVVVGFYRVCVIDQILPYSPADYVQRPRVPPESPTLGLGHLQFEALITTARLSPNINDFALITMLGLLACESSRPAAPASTTWARNTATASWRSAAKAERSSWFRYHPLLPARSNRPSTTVRTVRSCPTRSKLGWTGTRRLAG
jgi:hypothetical protein